MIENKIHVVPTGQIRVPAGRQRREVDQSYIEDLASGIDAQGLFHPIILNRDKELVIGECRLRAWEYLEKLQAGEYLKGIPARYTDEMDPLELRTMELKENLQRQDLHWQDAALAFAELFDARSEKEEKEIYADGEPGKYSYAMMGGELSCSTTHCNRMVLVGRAVRKEDKEVLACASARAAGALLDRRIRRSIENELVTFGQSEAKPSPLPEINLDGLDLDSDDIDIALKDLEPPNEEQLPYQVIQADFREWIDNYDGPRVNFVHCDFPYGIGLHKSDLYKTKAKDLTYDDSEDLFEDLCSTLVYATDDVLSASCHIMFWFPMSKYYATLRHFISHGFWVEPYPLVWGKSDKMGILPDPTRGPRRIYETAFIMSLGDRKIIRPTVNAVWASSESREKEHASQKSQVMLEDFFRMFIDEDSVVLDPTCGSGTALAAALKLGASSVIGLDINPECVRIAEDNCRNTYTLMVQGE